MSAEPMDFWKKMEKQPFTRPKLLNPDIFDYIEDTSCKNICGLYVVCDDGKEAVILIDQNTLDEKDKSRAASHVRAMRILLGRLGKKEDTAKFTFLAGYYLENGTIKVNSCANFGRNDNRRLGEATEGMVQLFVQYLKTANPTVYAKLGMQ